MGNLAIKGHATRGKEVIEILEMLGGRVRRNGLVGLAGNEIFCGYYIHENGYVDYKHYSLFNDTLVFTLEEFLKKFPYKVGDKVLYKTYGIYSAIKTIKWNAEKEQVFYRLDSKNLFVATADELKPYKEETMENKLGQITLDIPDGYKFFGINADNKVILTKIQPKYPKTYEECCKILQVTHTEWQGYLGEVLVPFQKLLICRNAYWKIAGEQMGLGKPWEPDWTNNYQKKWTINFYQGEVNLTKGSNVHFVLAFQTEEMRDAFYENFKELIEQCKDFL